MLNNLCEVMGLVDVMLEPGLNSSQLQTQWVFFFASQLGGICKLSLVPRGKGPKADRVNASFL